MDIWGRRKKHMRPKGGRKRASTRSKAGTEVIANTTTARTDIANTSTGTSPAEANSDGITLIVHVSDCSFPISCGDGQQTVKWLAIAAARRYGESATPSGRVRLRESYHSGRRPRPDTMGRPSSPSFSPIKHESAHNLPRYPQFGVTDRTTGRVLRRVDGVGGMYRSGMLAPIRVTSPKRKHHHRRQVFSEMEQKSKHYENEEEEEDNEEEQFLDAIQLTYDYARLEHPPDLQFRLENQKKLQNQMEEDLQRQRLLGNFDISSDGPSWRNQAAAAAATNPRPKTVYTLHELENDSSAKKGPSRKKMLQLQQQIRSKLPRRSMFASIPRHELAILRPTTTIAVTRPKFEGQSPATPIRNWVGPRLTVPEHFNTPSDLFDFVDDEKNDRILPNDLIKNKFVNGDHVWIDLDLEGRGSSSPFNELAFRKTQKKKVVEKKVIEQKEVIKEVVIEEKKSRRLLVSKRELRMEGKISDSNKKILNKLLNENIKKSKIDRVIKDEVEMSQVKKFMFERYLILENTFRHFR